MSTNPAEDAGQEPKQPDKTPDKKKLEYTELEKAEFRNFIYVNEASGTIEYRNTLVLEKLEESRQHISDLHASLLYSLGRDYARSGYLSKSSHRQVVQIFHMWQAVLQVKGIPATEAIEQAKKLDAFGEWWSARYRAESKKGQIEYVSAKEMDDILAGKLPSVMEDTR